MKLPGPDHPITVTASDALVRVRLGERVLADTRYSLVLREAGYGPERYLPREDVDMIALERSQHTSYCPFKGTASYFHIRNPGGRIDNAVWSYEEPYPAVSEIRQRLAFYPDKVGIEVG